MDESGEEIKNIYRREKLNCERGDKLEKKDERNQRQRNFREKRKKKRATHPKRKGKW